jgi:hypothetical protein
MSSNGLVLPLARKISFSLEGGGGVGEGEWEGGGEQALA